jgi:hypothetical protein
MWFLTGNIHKLCLYGETWLSTNAPLWPRYTDYGEHGHSTGHHYGAGQDQLGTCPLRVSDTPLVVASAGPCGVRSRGSGQGDMALYQLLKIALREGCSLHDMQFVCYFNF